MRTGAALIVAILAVSSAAVLVRWAETDPVALALWRTAGGALVLGVPALRTGVRPRGDQWWWLAAAGGALALHFVTWLASLQLTSVAASVTLVSSSPLLIAGYLWLTGRPPTRRTWRAIAIAFTGVVVIVAGDALGSPGPTPGGASVSGSALLGDALALIGAAALAVYLVIGDRLRVHMPTSVYSGWTYAFAAGSLVPVAVVADVPLWGYDSRTWIVIAATVAGPQLLGHTLLNGLLHRLGSVTVSLALLAEPFGASLLVWLLFAELPPLAAAVGAPLVVVGLALQLRAASSGGAGPP